MLDIQNHYIPKGGLSHDDLFRKISSITSDNSDFFIVADFDKTLTSGDSFSVWSFLARSGIMGQDYTKRRDDLYAHYRPIELDNSLDFETKNSLMYEWWYSHLSLWIEYGVNKKQIDEVVPKFMKWREGIVDFFEITKKLNIPIIIISAGIGNFIEEIFKLSNIDLDNISIESNFLLYDNNGTVIGIDKTHIIHTFNKNNHILNDFSRQLVGKRKKAVVLGDSTGDLRMIDLFDIDNYLSIGLLTTETELEYFDNSGFDLVNKKEDFSLINSILNNNEKS